MSDGTLMALDIGGGTQDLLIWDTRQNLENAVKMVLPASTRILARKIQRLTVQREPLFLDGRLMGGGAVTGAVRRHLAAGLPVCATPRAALTLNDNLENVQKWGMVLMETAPPGFVTITLGDVRPGALLELFSTWEIPPPTRFAVAVQDHGFNPLASNRRFRFQHWEKFLQQGGHLEDLAYFEPPPYLTRMQAVAETLPGVLLMDTCAAAVQGTLLDSQTRKSPHQGLMVVNLGNAHTFAALVQNDQLYGIYEHHTGLLTPGKLFDHLSRFRAGELTNEEVFGDQGHGCAYQLGYAGGPSFSYTVITGPQRRLARGWPDGVFAAPFGDMMLTGCFGLVDALRKKTKLPIQLDEGY